MRKAARAAHRAHVPAADGLVERLGAFEHFPHRSDPRGVPLPDVVDKGFAVLNKVVVSFQTAVAGGPCA